MREVVIVSAVRTAIGKFGGSLKDISPAQLGSVVLKDALSKAGAGAEEKGIEPLAVIKGYGLSGVAPELMGTGLISASKKALGKAGIKVNDLDLIEANEAFAAQSIAVNREMGFDPDIHELKRRKGSCGLATLCVGGGQGVALIVKR